MSDIAIKVESLSKRYRIGLKEETKDTFVGAMGSILKSPIDNLKRLQKLTTFNDEINGADDIIWALKDVSFEVKRGEVIGIIGANGAGKSTLLKILAQITHPTSGRVELIGRVASLLEVGTGFHPELTGRENIYLNGTILGMTKKEIDRKLDEIIAFSGVKKFIDTPVKRYSSGMRVRLAFSVAAHLDPEILLIDEVLAVGDAEFQKKCLGKIENISKQGRTILFVSHNMAAVENICDRCILIDGGEIMIDDDSEIVIASYLNDSGKQVLTSFCNKFSLINTHDKVSLNSVRLIDPVGNEINTIRNNGKMGIEINYTVTSFNKPIIPSVNVYNNHGKILFSSVRRGQYKTGGSSNGQNKYILWLPPKIFSNGIFNVGISLFSPSPMSSERIIQTENFLTFKVVDKDLTEIIGARGSNVATSLRPQFEWTYKNNQLLHLP
jgi:lipopolysaccharide transport system ATP-binding protein